MDINFRADFGSKFIHDIVFNKWIVNGIAAV